MDGQSVPNQPLETNFKYRDIVSCYAALLDTSGHSDPNSEFDIDIKRFMDGSTILAFNLEATSTANSLDYWVKPTVAHSRLELKFGSPTPEPINIILMGIYPQVLYIDKARNVSLPAQ